MKRIGILGLQGAVQDHERHIRRCGALPVIVKTKEALKSVDALILPGGESTVMTRFLHLFGMTDTIKQHHAQGMPMWGICAGSILLARESDGSPGTLGLIDMTVKRNAYGRHEASFERKIMIPAFRGNIEGVFIRAPRIIKTGRNVEIHAYDAKEPVFVREKNGFATTFHPELTNDSSIHSFFIASV